MKKYIVTFGLILNSVLFAQSPEIKSDLPTVIPPSPTVSALMKFEETPVSNYTGLPDVSIPLFSSGTHSKDIGVDISLKYHAGVGANDRSSDVGLGWSLFAGGTISRTVRGLPDEELILGGGSNGFGKVGIYHTSTPNYINNYYFFENNVMTGNGSITTNEDVEKVNEFLWESLETGKYDSEHDLWQFNFMGNSGRFYIKKNMQTNQLEVKPLDDYRVTITNTYATVGNNNFIPTGFTIFDEKGYKYIFDIIEKTVTKTATIQSWDNLVPNNESISADKIYNSSFHLSKVYDNNNKLVVEFIYNPDNVEIKECFTNISEIRNEDYDGICLNDRYCRFEFENVDNSTPPVGVCDGGPIGNFKKIKPYLTTSAISTITTVKKLEKISIPDIAEISFTFVKDRQDTNIQLISTASSLKEIRIKNWNGSLIKMYKLVHGYSEVIGKRMVLSKLEEYSSDEISKKEYEFFYETNDSNGHFISKDYWGYFNLIPSCAVDNLNRKETTPSFSSTDLLQKIKYPTKGCAIFNFEANRYSFVGDQAVTDFSDNQDNYQITNTVNLTFTNSLYSYLSISTTEDRKVKFYPSIVLDEDPFMNTKTFGLFKKINGIWTEVANSIACPYSNGTCCIDYILEKNKEYALKRISTDYTYTGTDTMTIEYFSKNSIEKKFLYGGGNRIKQIGYFDKDAPQEYYTNPSSYPQFTPVKEKNYSYTLPTDNSKSSGSLSFDKPIFKFYQTQTPCIHCGSIQNPIINFTSYTTLNNLLALKTQGSDVGYKNVSVFESNNGKTDYIYTSPIDYPNVNNGFIAGSITFSTENLDYKRGFLLKETIYDNQSRKLTETENVPTFVEFIKESGVKPFGDCEIAGNFSTYQSYKNYYLASVSGNGEASFEGVPFDCSCGLPLDYIGYQIMYEAYGWAKLTSKNTKNYFYPNGGTTPNIVESNETFTYNSLNKQIASHTVDNSVGDILTTNYFYHTGNSPFSQNRISEIERIESKRNTSLLSESKINYSNTWGNNQSYLPYSIEVKKGSTASEVRLRNNAYDEFGHVLEVQQENGTKISYIYGYNKTQPIAKIENMAYASISTSDIANLQSLSNTGTEANLITALNTFRASLPNAMITTVTYKPLIGISTMTDPKGDKITYHYDSFNRLEFVKDKNGNILSENQYHYKN